MFKPLKDKIIVRPEQRIKSTLDLSMMQEADTVGYVTAVGDEAAAEAHGEHAVG